jgi:hypothetical protein
MPRPIRGSDGPVDRRRVQVLVQTVRLRRVKNDKAILVMELIARMRTGRWVALRGLDLAAVAKEWRDISEKYRSHQYFVLLVGACASTSKRGLGT